MKSVALHNLGCKVNAYELEVMQQKLQDRGYKIVPFDSDADIYIVNTCTVTNIADRKSRQMLHRAKHRNPDAVVVAVGCFVQAGEENRMDDCIDLAVGNQHKKDIVEILEAYLEEHTADASAVTDIGAVREYEEMRMEQSTEHTRAYIKIQDGCNQFCSYCIIPYARGRVRSRDLEDVIEEVKQLAAAGYQEVVLTGIHLSSYGVDKEDDCNLLALIQAVHEVDGIRRIRLGSLEPRIITEEFARTIGSLEKMCPHFHLSLQSGCDATLKRMNRRYTAEEYYEKCELLRKYFDHPALTTDVIVGFPQESEEEFETTKKFLEKVNFYETHIFKYSRRKGTRADQMEGQIPEEIKAQRSHILQKLHEKNKKRFEEYYIGRPVEVLFEEKTERDGVECYQGHTREYLKVTVPDKGKDLHNKICDCILQESDVE